MVNPEKKLEKNMGSDLSDRHFLFCNSGPNNAIGNDVVQQNPICGKQYANNHY